MDIDWRGNCFIFSNTITFGSGVREKAVLLLKSKGLILSEVV